MGLHPRRNCIPADPARPVISWRGRDRAKAASDQNRSSNHCNWTDVRLGDGFVSSENGDGPVSPKKACKGMPRPASLGHWAKISRPHPIALISTISFCLGARPPKPPLDLFLPTSWGCCRQPLVISEGTGYDGLASLGRHPHGSTSKASGPFVWVSPRSIDRLIAP